MPRAGWLLDHVRRAPAPPEGPGRWIEGDVREGEYGFCGAPVAPERSYCPHHCALAYVAVSVTAEELERAA